MSTNGFPTNAEAIYYDSGNKTPFVVIVTDSANNTARFVRLSSNTGWIIQVINFNNQPITSGNVSVRVYYT